MEALDEPPPPSSWTATQKLHAQLRTTRRQAYNRTRELRGRVDSSLPRTFDILRSMLNSAQPGRQFVEAELVRSLGSSRQAVRAALQMLAAQGVVERRTKVGTTARGAALLPLGLLLTDEEKFSRNEVSSTVEVAIIEASEVTRAWFGLERVALVEGSVWYRSEPIGATTAYIPLSDEEAHQYDADAIRDLGVIGFLENGLGVKIGESETRVATVNCDADTAARLGVAEGAPMLWVEDYVCDVTGRPRAVEQGRYRGDRVAFETVATRAAAESLHISTNVPGV